MNETDKKCGPITCDEADQILSRFNASHWKSSRPLPEKEVARYSIPANPQRDDDLRLGSFIAQVRMERKVVEAAKKWRRGNSRGVGFTAESVDLLKAVDELEKMFE